VPGGGFRWPVALQPIYRLLERTRPTRDAARRLGLVTIAQMLEALVEAVEHPRAGIRTVEVPELRAGGESSWRS
jgi:hypothetical protein